MATVFAGTIIKVAGPVIVARNVPNPKLNDIVRVGNLNLTGEVIRIDRNESYIQVFEDTALLKLGEPVLNTHDPLSVMLAPGMLGMVYDGIQRPLEKLRMIGGDFITRGLSASPIDLEKKWNFKACVKTGDKIEPGTVLGIVMEMENRAHKIMTPANTFGIVKKIESGLYTINEPFGFLNDGTELKMLQKWPVKKPRPYIRKLDPVQPFITGQRVLDTLFPICLGGSAIVPGGFGCGKTVVEHMIAKHSNADIIVYVGCGERGNEMTDVLTEFPELQDPYTGKPLMERTILIANTSNMPVAAREASIYCGITIAEYYRDMGYNCALLVDSSSRWAEAMREISSRLEEMPGEEGYPTYLATRISRFYERSGKVVCIGDKNREGSVTIIGAVSPPGGDFSEPVTQNSQRVVGAIWALDPTLAHKRHFPSINWNRSYSLYHKQLQNWFNTNISTEWADLIQDMQKILQADAQLQEIIQLVGPDNLEDNQRIVLETGRAIRQDFLQQNAFSDTDASCSLKKQKLMIEAIKLFYGKCLDAVEHKVPADELVEIPQREELSRFKDVAESKIDEAFETYKNGLDHVIKRLIQRYSL